MPRDSSRRAESASGSWMSEAAGVTYSWSDFVGLAGSTSGTQRMS